MVNSNQWARVYLKKLLCIFFDYLFIKVILAVFESAVFKKHDVCLNLLLRASEKYGFI